MFTHRALALVAATAITAATACVACAPNPHEGVGNVVDPCEPVVLEVFGADDARTASVVRAAQMWNDAAGTSIIVDVGDAGAAHPDAPRVPITFEEAAWAFHGQFDDVERAVYVNSLMEEDSERTIVIAHELGHAFALLHEKDDDRLMKPGNMDTPVGDEDVAALQAVWGACTTP